MVEPDWFADGDFSWLDAADIEARAQPQAIAAAPLPAPAEVGGEAESQAEPEPVADAQPDPTVEVASLPEPEPEPEPVPESVVEGLSLTEPAAEPQIAAEPQVAPEPPVEVASLTEPVAEPQIAADLEVAPEPPVEVASLTEPVAEPEVAAESQVAEAPRVAPQLDPEPTVESAIAFEVPQPVEVSGADEEPVMWLGGQRDAADEIEIAATASHPESPPAPRRDPVAWPATDRGGGVTQAVAPPLAMTEEELAQLARDEGWDDAEVSAIRAMISRPALGAVELPGAAELDEAMSALQAVPIGSRSDEAAPRQWAKSATPDEETSPYQDWAFEVEPAPAETPARQLALAPRSAAPDPEWLRRRRGPAATAYRRIRRLFNG